MDLTEIFGDAASWEGAGDGKVGYLPTLLGANLTEVAQGESSALISSHLGSRIDKPAAIMQCEPCGMARSRLRLARTEASPS